jgi:hypothetical protein
MNLRSDLMKRPIGPRGELFIVAARLRGTPVIRLAIGNVRTTEDDLRRAWEVLRECATAP